MDLASKTAKPVVDSAFLLARPFRRVDVYGHASSHFPAMQWTVIRPWKGELQ